MSNPDTTKEKKQFKIVFNGTKKELITSGSKFSKFIKTSISQYGNVNYLFKNL